MVIARVRTVAQLREIAERSRLALSAQPFATTDGYVAVTASLGATCGTPDGLVKSLIEDADQALYRAKDAGRNRVTFSEKTAA